MEREGQNGKGVRLTHLNVVMICVGLVIAALMAYSMYQTTSSVRNVVTVTESYMTGQMTGGMLRDMSGKLSELAAEFVRSPEPGTAKAYEAQMKVLGTQLDTYTQQANASAGANVIFLKAVEAFQEMGREEKRAMRLAADVLPAPAFEALPDFLKETELTGAEQALSPEEKKAAATALLVSETYKARGEEIRTNVDLSHRLSSEDGRVQADETFSQVKRIVSTQTILIILFIALAVIALILNRVLIISPIRRGVHNLDRREPLPEKGCYEVRHLARVYNDVLKDNEEKTKALSYTASHDALTGVWNRDAFDKRYREIEHRRHYGVIMLDVDHFKQYNDEFGHDIGDQVLCTAVEAMKRHFRSEDHISRVGGDEFCIIMPGADQEQAGKIVEKIEQINRELKEDSNDLPPVSVSAGIAFWDRPNPDGSLLKDADTALMDLKKTRDHCCAVYMGSPA